MSIGYVAIGRNEGRRLARCLEALSKVSGNIVYVDSGSTDDSLEIAKKSGVEIVALTADKPFTAARARNAGFERLLQKWPAIELVMFIDGDCAVIDDFPAAARAELGDAPDIGIVTGRCRELNRGASIYNLVCDMEWDGPVGDIDACGGIFMARAEAFQAANGFNPSVIAAEDDDFCIRVRENGWRIRRIAEDMCFHDAEMTRFDQWWRRAVRAGHAYEQVASLHKGYFAGPRRRALIWGLILPTLTVIMAPFTNGLSLALLLLYPLSFIRTRANLIKGKADTRDATIYSGFLTLSKFPNLIGMLDFHRKRLFGKDLTIVEYK